MDVETTQEMASKIYSIMAQRIAEYKNTANRPLTLAEKIMAGHYAKKPESIPKKGIDYVFLHPDRVALQDVTGQMVMLQFMLAEMKQTSLPTTVHCDHLIRAVRDGESDTKNSLDENREVFLFLESAASKYGCGFWRPGAGIIHQVVLENYAFPGGLLIGTDSHTPNAGGLGMMAIGVGGVDAAETMAGMPWEILHPKLIGIKLVGSFNGWTSPKDVILKVAGELGVSGGTNSIVEYFGPGASSLSCTGKATICNMGAEIGATTSIFAYDESMGRYLRSTGREEIANLADENRYLLTPDSEVESEPEKYYDTILEIDLSTLEPHVVGPHTPDLARPISEFAKEVAQKGYVDRISVALIGSCTNSSYEDMSRAADVAGQAAKMGVSSAVPLLVTPGSEMIRATIMRDGQMRSLQKIGATVLANACGPCIGQWSRPELQKGDANTIVTSFNRNFPGRNDGRRETMNFIASPEIVLAFALGGRLSFNPMHDKLRSSDGAEFLLEPPKTAPDVPKDGFENTAEIYVPPSNDPSSVRITLDPSSKRLQKLEPFKPWDGGDFEDMHLMAKAQGKCTTDHISPAGAWLSLRGHLDALSDNMLLGAVSDFDGTIGEGTNVLNGERAPYAQIAREYKKQNMRWVIIGDENYGEGSSREHAAMTPRYLGCAAVIAKSFARIHETNLKKQGVLALVFENSDDYAKVQEGDKISLLELGSLAPDAPVKCIIRRKSGQDEILLHHSYNKMQLEWFYAGSALNVLRKKQ